MSVVTGAASGIGEAVSRQLAAEGHSLLLVDRNAEALDQLASHLHAEALCLDLTGHDALDKLKTFIATKQLALDWVVNNAGVGCRGLMVETPLAKQKTVIDLNCSA